jgi:hypothetical protein
MSIIERRDAIKVMFATALSAAFVSGCNKAVKPETSVPLPVATSTRKESSRGGEGESITRTADIMPLPYVFPTFEQGILSEIQESFKSTDLSGDRELTGLMGKIENVVQEVKAGNVGLVFEGSYAAWDDTPRARVTTELDQNGRITFHILRKPETNVELFHELGNTALLFERYKEAVKLSTTRNISIHDAFELSQINAFASDQKRLIDNGWRRSVLPLGYFQDADLLMRAYSAMYKARLPTGKTAGSLQAFELNDKRKVNADTQKVILYLSRDEKYRSIENAGRSKEWRWYIERLWTLEYATRIKTEIDGAFITVCDKEVGGFPAWVRGEQIFDGVDALESNEVIRKYHGLK